MNRSLSVINPIEGEVLRDAVLDPEQLSNMNFAREEFYKLTSILMDQIVPALGGSSSELACDISRHLELVRIFSGHFCYQHRHLGASFAEVGKRPGIDDGVTV